MIEQIKDITFEEQFPSLKDIFYYPEDNNEIGCEGDNVVSTEDILKHCLDKQRVKEILIKNMDSANYIEMLIDDLFKELGLDEEDGT